MALQLLKDGFNAVVDEFSEGYGIENPFAQNNEEKGAPRKFPRNLDSREFGGLKIEFQAWENKGLYLGEKAGTAASGALDSFNQSGLESKANEMAEDNLLTKATNKINEVAAPAKKAVESLVDKLTTTVGETFSALGGSANEIRNRDIATTESNSIAITQTNMTHCGTWQLFLPESISTNYAAGWSKTELGFLGNVLESALKVVPTQAVNAAKLLNREVSNPLSELLFQGIDHRTFSYSFTLFPKNANEASDMQDLIKFFKTNMAPRISPNTATLVLRYPNYFKIRYLKGGADNPFINKIAYCVLESFDVSYKDGSTGFHLDGSPSAIAISLQFREIEPIYREMICQGY